MSRNRKLEELIEINTAISSRLESRDLLKSITLSALALLNADSAEIWCFDSQSGGSSTEGAAGSEREVGTLPKRKLYRFDLLASAGTSDPLSPEDTEQSNAPSDQQATVLKLLGSQVEHDYDRSFIVSGLDRSLREALNSPRMDGYVPERVESAFFPIDDQRHGLFTVSREDRRSFQGDDFYFLEKLAIQAGISLRMSSRFATVSEERDEAIARIRRLRHRDLIGKSPAMAELQQTLELAAPSQASVLILGERGVGKERIADALHERSNRADKALIKLNCAGLVESLLESELFGYEKGAFTGADSSRAGLLEAADGGTLFLDEVGEMTPALQAKLLRFLQEGTFRRVGGTSEIKVSVRVVAATNRDIAGDGNNASQADGHDAAGESQLMRRDLFDRLATIVLRVPPLRERREDIAALLRYFLERYSILEEKPEITGFAPEIVRLMETADWPGNVRELENAVHRLVILHSGGPLIENADQVFVARRNRPSGSGTAPSLADANDGSLNATGRPDNSDSGSDKATGPTKNPVADQAVPPTESYFNAKDAFEADYVRRALTGSRGNISKAAESSGLDRGNFRLKMTKHAIDARDFKIRKKR